MKKVLFFDYLTATEANKLSKEMSIIRILENDEEGSIVFDPKTNLSVSNKIIISSDKYEMGNTKIANAIRYYEIYIERFKNRIRYLSGLKEKIKQRRWNEKNS